MDDIPIRALAVMTAAAGPTGTTDGG